MPPQLVTVPDALIPAIGYIRVSMAREEMISPEIQRSAISSWAQRMGRRIVLWIEDLDFTGRNFRRKIMKGIEAIETRQAVEILAYRYDRWGRNALESLANIVRVEQAGGQVHSVTEPVDAQTAIGRYNRINALGLAEMQSNLISESWKAAQANRVDRGLTTGGTPRFGYVRLGRVIDPHAVSERHRYRRDPADPEGERYEPDYESGLADIHIAMYNRYIEIAEGFAAIGQWLNVRDIRNVRGALWSDVTVRNVLDSGFAAGLLRLHDPDCRCANASSCRQRIYVPGAQPALLDEETWKRYREVRAERGRRPPRARYASYPLTGLIYCGHCCSPMAVQSGASTAGYGYRCERWHHYRDCPDAAFPRRRYVEDQVKAEVGKWARDIEERARVATVRVETRISAESDRDRLSRALADADVALTRLAVQKARAGDQMPKHVYEAAEAELLADRATKEAELGAASDLVHATSTDYAPIVASVLESWDTLPAQQIRDLLGQLVRHIKVFRVDGDQPRVVLAPVWELCFDCKVCEKRTS